MSELITTVVNIKITDDWNFFIGRFEGEVGWYGCPFPLSKPPKRGERAKIIKQYREYFYDRIENDPEFKRMILKLKGKILGCFCVEKPINYIRSNKRCHGEIILEYLNNVDEEGNLKKKLIPTKIGYVVGRWNLDSVTANMVIQALRSSGDLELALNNWENFIYEARLWLMANDDDESLFRESQYQVAIEEYPLLELYKGNEGKPPDVQLVLDVKLQVRDKAIKEQLDQLKQMIKDRKENE